MSVVALHQINNENPILAQARVEAAAAKLAYAGGLSPQHAWQLFSAGEAIVVDVRSAEERKFVGLIAGSLHVPWATGLSLSKNPRFVSELAAKVKKDAVILLLCRSGKRSVLAAETASKAGFRHVFNILEGFEGDLDLQSHRGQHNGWRFHRLPWTQE